MELPNCYIRVISKDITVFDKFITIKNGSFAKLTKLPFFCVNLLLLEQKKPDKI